MSSTPTREHIEAFGCAVARYLTAHRHHLNGFNWPIEEKCVGEAARRGLLSDLSVNGGFDETNRLRKAVAKEARKIQKLVPPPQRVADLADLAKFVISDWGNLKGNNPATILEYAKRISDIEVPFEQIRSAAQLRAAVPGRQRRGLFSFTGIASWSKWLNFVWNDWALIYDARIAFALNVIHFLHEVDAPVFPVPPGRNQQLAALDAESSAAFRWLGGHGGACPSQSDVSDLLASAPVPGKDAYCYYLAVMDVAHQKLWPSEESRPLVHTEMLLFMLSISIIANDFAREMLMQLKPRAWAVVEVEKHLGNGA